MRCVSKDGRESMTLPPSFETAARRARPPQDEVGKAGGIVMPSIATAAPGPWYATLTRTQWKTLAAANLGWMFDGYETFALILTVGVALRQLLDPGRVSANPRLCRHRHRHHAPGLGHRRHRGRHPGRLYRPPPHHDLRHPGLFADHRLERARLRLDVVCAAALPGRHRHRLGMVDRRLDHRRGVARSRPRQRRRPDAMRPGDRVLPRLAGLALCGAVRPGRLAHHVRHRRAAGAVRFVDPHRHSGIGALGAHRRKPPPLPASGS